MCISVLGTFPLGACVLLARGRTEYVRVMPSPEGAAYYVDGEARQPGECLALDRTRDHVVEIRREDSPVGQATLKSTDIGWSALLTLGGGIPGIIVDGAIGAFATLQPKPDSDASVLRLLQFECQPWRRNRVTLHGGYTLAYGDETRRSLGTNWGQAWLTYGRRGFHRVELFFEMFALRFWDPREEPRPHSPGWSTLFSVPLPLMFSPVGINFYPVMTRHVGSYLGAGASLLTPGVGTMGVGPITAHAGVRIHLAPPWELGAQLKYIGVGEFSVFGEPATYVDRLVAMTGVGASW